MSALPPPDPDTPRVLLHMPVDIRSASLALLAALAAVFTLHWASAVFIPLLLGVMFSHALSPAVEKLHRWRIPRWLSSAVLVFGIVGGIGFTGYWFSDDATELIESLPQAARKLATAVQERRGVNPIDKVQEAAAQLERAAEGEAAAPATARGVQRVQIERPRFNIKDYLWTGTIGLVSLLGQALIVCLVTYFLVASGTTFRRKLVRIAGPTFSQKKITIQALDEISAQIQRYLLVQLLISALVGVATTVAFALFGLEHAAVWGIAAAVLNFIPYIGSAVVIGGSALSGLLQFGTPEMALALAGSSLAIRVVSGYVLTPWLTSRASRMNPVAVFVGVLAWGWLWGAWGLLLGVPILMIVKAVCDRVDDLRPIGELLGD